MVLGIITRWVDCWSLYKMHKNYYDMMVDILKRTDIEVLSAFLEYYGKLVDNCKGNITHKHGIK